MFNQTKKEGIERKKKKNPLKENFACFRKLPNPPEYDSPFRNQTLERLSAGARPNHTPQPNPVVAAT